jgi:hypothetical protein
LTDQILSGDTASFTSEEKGRVLSRVLREHAIIATPAKRDAMASSPAMAVLVGGLLAHSPGWRSEESMTIIATLLLLRTGQEAQLTLR